MQTFRRLLFLLLFLSISTSEAKLPELTPTIISRKIQEIMKAHASHKSWNDEIVKRALQNYLDALDPSKTYFIYEDVKEWLEPSQTLITQVITDSQHNRFDLFFRIHEMMMKAVQRHRELVQKINEKSLPENVSIKEFKDMAWTKNEGELLDRLTRIRTIQIKAAARLNEDIREKALQRIDKRQLKIEEDILATDVTNRERYVLTNILKAVASALDAHTEYFTPDEASLFMILVQQRLFGIGAQLRDDLNGFTVVKVIEGGPAAMSKELKPKDRIIAVNGEPVVGMDIKDAVERIHGPENTTVTLTVVREIKEGDLLREEQKEISISRGEVIFKEARYQSSYEPFGDGVIAYLKLYTFYQDQDHSSASDLTKELNQLKSEHNLKGVVLDLRSNTGGLLTQAVEVTGLFMSKGIVVSVKDNTGTVHHLRNLESKAIWDGPLIVLVNKASASASEIVAQALQDYGCAMIVGDECTYGKGSFQTFTLNTTKNAAISPEGEYKVTRGRYYTVSGRTPQLVGVSSDIVVRGSYSESELGEKYGKFPLNNDTIKENYDDDLSDIPYTQRNKVRMLYKFDLQPKMTTYVSYFEKLRKNSSHRLENSKNYQNFLTELKKDVDVDVAEEDGEHFGQNDLQLNETMNIMKDLIVLMQCDGKCKESLPL